MQRGNVRLNRPLTVVLGNAPRDYPAGAARLPEWKVDQIVAAGLGERIRQRMPRAPEKGKKR